jgi:phosphoribosyl-ATP pyrophosphohydrolase
VLWSEAGVQPREIWAEMDRREKLYGIAEKIQKSPLAELKHSTKQVPVERARRRRAR